MGTFRSRWRFRPRFGRCDADPDGECCAELCRGLFRTPKSLTRLSSLFFRPFGLCHLGQYHHGLAPLRQAQGKLWLHSYAACGFRLRESFALDRIIQEEPSLTARLRPCSRADVSAMRGILQQLCPRCRAEKSFANRCGCFRVCMSVVLCVD